MNPTKRITRARQSRAASEDHALALHECLRACRLVTDKDDETDFEDVVRRQVLDFQNEAITAALALHHSETDPGPIAPGSIPCWPEDLQAPALVELARWYCREILDRDPIDDEPRGIYPFDDGAQDRARLDLKACVRRVISDDLSHDRLASASTIVETVRRQCPVAVRVMLRAFSKTLEGAHVTDVEDVEDSTIFAALRWFNVTQAPLPAVITAAPYPLDVVRVAQCIEQAREVMEGKLTASRVAAYLAGACPEQLMRIVSACLDTEPESSPMPAEPESCDACGESIPFGEACMNETLSHPGKPGIIRHWHFGCEPPAEPEEKDFGVSRDGDRTSPHTPSHRIIFEAVTVLRGGESDLDHTLVNEARRVMQELDERPRAEEIARLMAEHRELRALAESCYTAFDEMGVEVLREQVLRVLNQTSPKGPQ